MNKDQSKFTRRYFLRQSAIAVGALVVSSCTQKPEGNNRLVAPQADGQTSPTVSEPTTATAVSASPIPTATPTVPPNPTVGSTETASPHPVVDGKPRVVHVRAADVTHWDGSETPFYSSVNQEQVNAMVLEGLGKLSGKTSAVEIWSAIFTRVNPEGYKPKQKIAIKVNFNNSDREPNNHSQHDNNIDALPQPIIGLLSSLVEAGVDPTDVICYDATGSEGGGEAGRTIPAYFYEGITSSFPTVAFVGKNRSGVTPATHGKDPSLSVTFSGPGQSMKARLLADVLYDASYIINIPLLKCHSGNENTPVTLSFKNHCGSIDYVFASDAANSLHTYITVSNPHYSPNYSPLVDLYNNPHIRNKTILTMGDGLFGSMWGTSAEVKWNTFGAPANSLFFSFDPVAIDCVMADFLRVESQVRGTGGFTTPRAYDTMFCAQNAGLGICEGNSDNPGGNPWQTPYGSGYTRIEYLRHEI